MGIGLLRGIHHHGVIGFGLQAGDVVGNRAVKQRHPLRQIADITAQHIGFILIERRAIQPHLATGGAPDPGQGRVKSEGLAGPGGVRVNKSGCLDRCAGGPVAVVYPEETWYTFVDAHDIDEIVDSHLKAGQVVRRLLLAPDVGR